MIKVLFKRERTFSTAKLMLVPNVRSSSPGNEVEAGVSEIKLFGLLRLVHGEAGLLKLFVTLTGMACVNRGGRQGGVCFRCTQ